MYRAHYEVLLGEEEISKIEGMLKEKWHASDIVIEKRATYWYISFVTDDHKKVYGLRRIIEKYRGKVLYQWTQKLDQ